jgi:type IV/VI secretion system ImpK/VasF family protein
MAAFAVVAMVDESVAGAGNPAFEEWIASPLAKELFQVDEAGAQYFRNIDTLLVRPDSQDLGDVLEVYLLGLLLGFRGNRGADPASLGHYRDILLTRVRRVRASSLAGSPYPQAQSASVKLQAADHRLMWTACISAGGAVVLFLLLKLILLVQTYNLKSFVAGARL